MPNLEENLKRIQSAINGYCQTYNRNTQDVELIAVGKKHGIDKIATFAKSGQRHFGENYLQEAIEKMQQIAALDNNSDSLEWHFIGHIQSRKCRELATHFDWVDTVESLKVAKKLSQYRTGKPLNILIQVNIDNEETKSGATIEEVAGLVAEISSLPNLKLRGLMIIPRAREDLTEQRAVFARCRNLLEQLNQSGYHLDQLSMGMTADMEAAIAEGATQVRIGTALFGARPAK